ESITDADRMYWKNLQMTNDLEYVYGISETIYSGNAGIALFFIELYKLTGDSKYIDVINKIKNWLIYHCKNNPSKNAAFYTGRLGVAYVLLEIEKLFDDKTIEAEALEIATKGVQNYDFTINPDLLSGNAGVMLGFAKLYDASKKDWLLERINEFAGHLIKSCSFSLSDGLSWGNGPTWIKNLCGFSHGASGIGFSFLELANYFNQDGFYWLARQATQYENNQIRNNEWPDYRKDAGTKEEYAATVEKLKNGDIESFFTPNRYNAWCHGACGIGLARARAYSLLKNTDDLSDVKTALALVQSTKYFHDGYNYNYTICH